MYSLVIIEDDLVVLNKLCSLIPFSELNIQLTGSATNGADGLKCIETVTPNIVISDISMPVMSGIELLEHLPDRNIKFIIITGHADFKYAQTAISHGVVEYLLKPVFPDDVIKALRKCVNLLDSEKQPGGEIKPEHQKNVNPIIYKMKKYAEENIKEVSLDKLAQHLDLSANYLRNLFREETGTSFKQYVVSVRMERAKKLFEGNYYKVYEVSEMVGYKDVKSFRAVFKEHFGIVPSEISEKLADE